MTEWGIDTLFNPGKRHMDEEKRRLQSTREEIGDSSGGRRIDLESGTVTISRRPKNPPAATEDESAEGEATESEVAEGEAAENHAADEPDTGAHGREVAHGGEAVTADQADRSASEE
ncbi:MAG TPA: DUF6191 domain-containing protein [Jatrophihabitans sp.]|jgi:hypothetical protein